MDLNRRFDVGPSGGPIETDEDEEDEEDEDEEIPTIEDLNNVADPAVFDQTYLLDRDALDIAPGETTPIPRPWQGVPRAAIVFNFNYVYDETAEEWVRQNPSSGGGAAHTKAIKTSNQTGIGGGVVTDVTFQDTTEDELGGFDAGNNEIAVPADGNYLLGASLFIIDVSDNHKYRVNIEVNGSVVVRDEEYTGTPQSGDSVITAVSDVRDLASGDAVSVSYIHDDSSNNTISATNTATYLTVLQLP